MKSKSLSVATSMIWLLLFFSFSFMTLSNAFKSSKRRTWTSATNTIHLAVENIRADLIDNIWHKDELVDLNGGWTRLLGMRTCNDVIILNNCQMIRLYKAQSNTDVHASIIDSLTDTCASLGIQSLFVMFPTKIDPEKSVLPRGAPYNFSNETCDSFLSNLHKTPYLDLRPFISHSSEAIAKHFFKTDHHWNFEGAFEAFPIIVKSILDQLDVPAVSFLEADSNNWSRVYTKRDFLGSLGRRTGGYFGGSDNNVHYLTPKFETDIMKSVPSQRDFKRGSFEDSIICDRYIAKPTSRFDDQFYSAYEGNKDLILFTNPKAPLDKHIFVIKNSFANPVVAFLSTVFRQITVIDLRAWHGVALAKYIQFVKPDIVCVMYNNVALGEKRFFDFDTAIIPTASYNRRIVKENLDINIEANSRNHNYVAICGKLPSSSIIKFSVDNISLSGTTNNNIAVIALIDTKTRKRIAIDCLGSDMGFVQERIFETPAVKGDYELDVYAGIQGQTSGIGALFKNIKLEIFSAK